MKTYKKIAKIIGAALLTGGMVLSFSAQASLLTIDSTGLYLGGPSYAHHHCWWHHHHRVCSY